MKLFRPKKIYVEAAARDYPHTEKILSALPGVPVEEVEDRGKLLAGLRKNQDPIGEGKRSLLLARDQGRSFKPFPESRDYLSCDYFTLHVAEGCDLECSYCILQAYLTNPLLTVFVNLEEMLGNLQKTLLENRHRFWRIGTGQLADSLSLDPLTAFSETLVPFFAGQDNAVLELKTKSDHIERLLKMKSAGRTIVSWSLNPDRIQREEEHKCASIDERLAAAKKILEETDYRIGFHLDPIIDTPGWERDYEGLLEKIFSRIDAERIVWMSLGCLRFMPRLKGIMQRRFPNSKLPLAEWGVGMDGKFRYLKSRRVEIYKRMIEMIRRRTRAMTLYLSMESPEVWRLVLGKDHTPSSVCELLDQAGKNLKLAAF